MGTKCNSLTQQFIGISTTIDKHVSMVVDIPINCCVRLLHLVPILLLNQLSAFSTTIFGHNNFTSALLKSEVGLHIHGTPM